MQGRDLSPLIRGEVPDDWRQEFYYEHDVVIAKDVIPASEAVVTKTEKYIHWPDFDSEEFFDLKADPFELKNLASQTDLKPWRQKLAALKRSIE